MTQARKLSPLLSFRRYQGFTVAVHHGTGRLLRLNESAGRLLERIEAGDTTFSPEESAFVSRLEEHAFFDDAAPGQPGGQSDWLSRGDGRSAVLDGLTAHAAESLIPLQAQIELTYNCPARCTHCYLAGEEPRPDEELSLMELERLFDELAALGGLFIVLTGGEPFLRGDLEEIVAAARRRRLAISLLTSGAGATCDRIGRLARLGLDGAQVSLHGPDAESHDRLAGRSGSFDAAWAALDAFKAHGVPVRAAVSVHRLNIDLLDRLADRLRQAGIPIGTNLSMLPRRDGRREPCHLQIEGEDLERAFRLAEVRRTPRLRDRTADDPPCNAGRAVVSIDPYGTLFPCLVWRRPAGSLRTESFSEIWRNSATLDKVRGLRIRDLPEWENCGLREFCNRCPGLALADGSGETGRSPLDCRQARVLLEMQEVCDGA